MSRRRFAPVDAHGQRVSSPRKGIGVQDLHASTTDPDALVFVEKWTDRAALTRHFGMPHLKEWRARAAEFQARVNGVVETAGTANAPWPDAA